MARGRSALGEPLAEERGLFERGEVGEGNSGLGDIGIGDELLVLLLQVAFGEEPCLGMMNRWHRRYA